jgi:nucleotide-binding universal stress UspA family protein
MYETILVPTDGSDHARRAAEQAFSIAEALDATVHVLGVADLYEAAGPFDAGGVSQDFVERIADESRAHVDDVAEMATGVSVETHVEIGTPRKAILTFADEYGADLIGMGTHGRSGVRRLVAGSVAEHVVRHADVPVLTARASDHATRTDYERILVPTDGSTCADVAVEPAVTLAAAYDATVHALYVVDVEAVTTGSDTAAMTDIVDHYESVGEQATGKIARAAEEAGVDVVTAIEEGTTVDTLLSYTDDHDVDLVTMGTHGRGGLQRVILGSTTERTIRQSPVPVLSVRPVEDSEE